MKVEGTLTQLTDGSASSKGDEYTGTYVRYVDEHLEISSYGQWYPLLKL